MRHGSLFSGIGGFDLAAEWMGWENVFHCEWNEFGQKVLKHYWPNAISYSDITKTDFTPHANTIDILTGGFPCQPYSTAGKRLGKEDDRHLWPEMLRAIREISPRYVVGENVRGLTNWNGGMVFDEVQADLEAEGYEVLPFLLPACGVGAPHRRDRIWFVAHSKSAGMYGREGNVCEADGRQGAGLLPQPEQPSSGLCENGITTNAGCDVHTGGLDTRGNSGTASGGQGENEQPGGWDENGQRLRVESGAGSEDAADTPGVRINRAQELENGSGQGGEWRGCDVNHLAEIPVENRNADAPDADSQQRCKGGVHKTKREKTERHAGSLNAPGDGWNAWQDFPTQSPLCNGNDGFPALMDSDAIFKSLGIEHPRQPAIGFAKWRNESIKAGGNAIVPQVAYEIFKAIAAMENQR